MDALPEDEPRGSASALFKSLNTFAATVVNIAHTRLQLLTTELQEEVQRAAELVIWAFIALFAALLGVFLGALTVIFYFWDTHRLLAALITTGVFVFLAIGAALVLIAKLRVKPPLLDDTLAELARDRDQLRRHL
jgi:uncharacterized membrane protein YqjE